MVRHYHIPVGGEVGQSAVEFQQMHRALATRVERLDELEEKAEAAEMAASGADADAAEGARDHPEDAALTLEEARAAIEALDAEAKAVHGALKTRTAEAETARPVSYTHLTLPTKA